MFKVGDRVRCVKPDLPELKMNEIYTVLEINETQLFDSEKKFIKVTEHNPGYRNPIRFVSAIPEINEAKLKKVLNLK